MTASTRFTGEDDIPEQDPDELRPTDDPKNHPEDYSPGPRVDMTKEADEADILEQQVEVPGLAEDPDEDLIEDDDAL